MMIVVLVLRTAPAQAMQVCGEGGGWPVAEDRSDHEVLVQLKQAVATHRAALAALYGRYAREFYNYAHRRRGLTPEDADEAVQEAFTRVRERIGTYDEIGGGGAGWMWRILEHVVTDFFRSPSRRRTVSSGGEISAEPAAGVELLPGGIDPAQVFEAEERRRCFALAWHNLSQEDREQLRPKRGPHSKRWPAAAARFQAAFEACYGRREGEELP